MSSHPRFSHLGTNISLGSGQSRRVSDSFRYLLDQCVAVKQPPLRYSKAPRQLVDLLYLSLKSKAGDFLDVFEDLTDGDKPHDEASWAAADTAIASRCGSHLGRYLDALDQILSCLEKIAVFLDINGEEAPWSKQFEAYKPGTTPASLPVIAILASNDRWKRFVTALCTVTGALGGELELQLLQIAEANERLIQVQRDSEEVLNKSHFQQLEDLRKHAMITAEVLGREDGFTCKCLKSHKVFWRIKDSFRIGRPRDGDGPQDDLCSLMVHSSSPHHYGWVDFHTKSSDLGDAPAEPQHPTRPQSLPLHRDTGQARASGGPSPVSKSTGGEKVPRERENRRVGFISPLGLGSFSARDRKDNKMMKEDTEVKKLPVVPAQIEADPGMGFCVYIQASRQLYFAATSGAQDNVPTDIKSALGPHINLSRDKSRLVLKLNHQASDSAAPWTAVTSVRNQFTSAEHLRLSTEQRLQLAYKMASSLFYLHSTPWLNNSWDGRDLYLPRQSDGSIQVVDPLLARRLDHKRRRSTQPPEIAEDEVAPSMPLIITRLGRFLVELSLGSSWSNIRRVFLAGDEAPERSAEADQVIFCRILPWFEDKRIAAKDKLCHHEGRLYFQAIQSCFFGDFGQTPGLAPSMEDDYFRRGVYEHILRPLQLALEDFQRRKSQLFGPSLKTIRQQRPASSQPIEAKDVTLFDDEELKDGDKTTAEKAKYADDWLEEYDGVLRVARTVSPKWPDSPEHRIRVAILDTGADATHDLLRSAFRRRQLVYQDFVGPGTDVPRDDHGHGTHVTSILLQMAPNVDIYVGRVSADGKTWKGSQVRKAIRWAVREKEVHIISMSFGFRDVDQSLEPIRQAILEAHAADVLVFAAAGNGGPRGPVAFPACMGEVISVGATNGRGERSLCNPILGPGQRLCAIGEAIPAAWIRPPKQEKGKKVDRELEQDDKGDEEDNNENDEENNNEEDEEDEDDEDDEESEDEDEDEDDQGHCQRVRRVGTSYATPVAAGIAAMVMDFVWADRYRRLAASTTTAGADTPAPAEDVSMGASEPVQGEDEKDGSYCPSVLDVGDMYEYRTLRTKRGMLAVFALMLNGEPGTIQSLSPSDLFNPLMVKPGSGDGNGILHTIIKTLCLAYKKPVY